MPNLYPATTTIPIYAVLNATGLLLTALRIHLRTQVPPNTLGPDDYSILLGALVATICTAIQYYNAIRGAGGGGSSDPARAIIEAKIDFAMIVIEKLAFGFIKLSFLFFYRRIFGVWKGFRRVNNVLIAVVGAWVVAFALADLLLCGRKIELHWALDQKLARTGCRDKGALLIAFAVTSVVTDGLVLGVPIVYLRRVQMARRKKIGAGVIFFLGTISTLAGLLRLIFLCIAYPLGRLTFGYSAPAGTPTPLVLQVFNPTFWVMVEMGLGVWAANLPALSPLMKSPSKYFSLGRTWRKLSGSLGNSSNLSRTLTADAVAGTNASKSHQHRARTGKDQEFEARPALGELRFDSYEMSHEREYL